MNSYAYTLLIPLIPFFVFLFVGMAEDKLKGKLGGLIGTAASDLAHWLIASTGVAYGSVFAAEALLFILSALLASRISMQAHHQHEQPSGMAQASFS